MVQACVFDIHAVILCDVYLCNVLTCTLTCLPRRKPLLLMSRCVPVFSVVIQLFEFVIISYTPVGYIEQDLETVLYVEIVQGIPGAHTHKLKH